MVKLTTKKNSTPEAIAGIKIIHTVNAIAVVAAAYLFLYSLLEHFGGDFFNYWTNLFSPISTKIGGWVPGISRMVLRIDELGYGARVPYVEHVLSFTFLLVALTPILNFFHTRKLILVIEKAKLERKIAFYGLVSSLGFCFLLFVFFYYGLHIKNVTAYGFNPHTSNIKLALYSFGNIFLAQIIFYCFGLCLGSLIRSRAK